LPARLLICEIEPILRFDLNPRRRRERTTTIRKYNDLQDAGGHLMEPRPGMVEWFRDYLQQRLAAGCRHGRTLLAEIRERGSTLAKFLSPWRQPPAKTTTAFKT
jgi:hypothetical protein